METKRIIIEDRNHIKDEELKETEKMSEDLYGAVVETVIGQNR